MVIRTVLAGLFCGPQAHRADIVASGMHPEEQAIHYNPSSVIAFNFVSHDSRIASLKTKSQNATQAEMA